MDSQLSKLVGRQVIVIGPSVFNQEKLQAVKLVAVEAAGIWIESDEVMESIVEKYRTKPASPAMAFFLPFAQITTILASLENAAVVEG